MNPDFHHVDNPSVYGGFPFPPERSARDTPNTEPFNIPTPQYEEPNTSHSRNNEHSSTVNKMVYGGLIQPKSYNGTTDSQPWLVEYNYIAKANEW